MRRILFITPPYHAGVVEVAGRWVPLNMVYLAGVAREAGFDAVIYDAMTKDVGHKEIERRIRKTKPDYVATSAITCTLPDALIVLQTAKRVNPAIKTLLGGIHPTFMRDEVFAVSPHVDFIIRGEGEKTLAQLLVALDAGKDPLSVPGVSTRLGNGPDRPLMECRELDALPKAYDLLDWEDYNYFIIPGSRLGAIDTSRGCDKECSFCSQRKFWRQSWRARSAESLIEDVERLHKEFGVNVILLTDDYPTLDRDRWVGFLDLLIEKDLGIYILMETRVDDILRDKDILPRYRRAGIIHIYVGTEATDQTTLDLFKKDVKVEDAREALSLLNANGIITETSMILGLPGDTKESIERTLELAKTFNPDFCHFLAIAPWPYADMYDTLKAHITVFDYRRYNLIDPVVKPLAMSLEDIDAAIVDCYRRFYMDKIEDVASISDEFKRQYMLVSMRLMMTNSFLIKKIGSLGTVPTEVERLLAGLAHPSMTSIPKKASAG